MLRLSLLAAALAAIAQADQKTYSTESCITKHRPAQYAPSSIPTSTRTSSQTVCYTTTTCGTATTTTTITPEPVSLTKGVSGNVLKARAAVTVFAAADEVTCSTTTTVSTGASTLFTGEYSASVAKRTAAALDSRAPFGQSRNPLLGKVLHRYGQSAFNNNQKVFAVDCLAQVTTYDIATSTIQEETTTETVTAATPTIYITLKNKAVDSEPVPITTTITAQPTNDVITSGVCTVTVASSTTTQHLKCAPTNLISQVDGYGIGETQGDSSNTRGLAPGSDPSACCQLCVDTEDCAASEDDPDAGNCFLWYTTPVCGLGFKYAAGSQKLEAGSGFLVQTGCGTIEETDS